MKFQLYSSMAVYKSLRKQIKTYCITLNIYSNQHQTLNYHRLQLIRESKKSLQYINKI